MKKTIILLIITAFLLCSCAPAESGQESSAIPSSSEISSQSETDSTPQSTEVSVKEEYPLAYDMLMRWIKGNGEKISFTEEDDITKAMKASPKIRALAEDAVVSYKNGVSFKNTWVEFTSDEPDLWLSVRKAFVDVTTTEQDGSYILIMKVFDTYNFEQMETSDGLGSALNNLAFMAQQMGVGKAYEWEAEITLEIQN